MFEIRALPLKGTTAQLSWGNKIQQEAIDDARKNIAEMQAQGTHLDEWIQIIVDTFVQVISTPERRYASWWIEHRPGRPYEASGKRLSDWEYIIMGEMQFILSQRMKVFEEEHKDEIRAFLLSQKGVTLQSPRGKE